MKIRIRQELAKAARWNGHAVSPVADIVGEFLSYERLDDRTLVVTTMANVVRIPAGHYLIIEKGKTYRTVEPDRFESEYEEVA